MNEHIAIPFADGEVFPHFGHATQFKIYTVEADKVVSAEVCSTDGIGHEDLALWFLGHEVKVVLCGNIGPGAQGALVAAGILPLAGVTGSADAAVEQFIAGTLEVTAAPTCGGHTGGGCGGACSHCHHGSCGGH